MNAWASSIAPSRITPKPCGSTRNSPTPTTTAACSTEKRRHGAGGAGLPDGAPATRILPALSATVKDFRKKEGPVLERRTGPSQACHELAPAAGSGRAGGNGGDGAVVQGHRV